MSEKNRSAAEVQQTISAPVQRSQLPTGQRTDPQAHEPESQAAAISAAIARKVRQRRYTL